MVRNCPDCEAPLTTREYKGVTVDSCELCAGLFFDEGEVNNLRHQGENAMKELDELVQPSNPPDPTIANKFRLCPSCGKAMHPYRYLYTSPIVLDSCDDCGGVWVQNGELERMQEYLKTQAPAKVAQVRTHTAATTQRAGLLHRFVRGLARETNS